jgi:hypothetical protein
MYKILKSVGFKYGKINYGRKFIMERGDIVAAPIKFLRTVHSLRISGDERPVFYLDETWVNQNRSKIQLAGLIEKGRLGSCSVKGRRLIVYNAESAKTDFIPESKWIFRSRPQMRDSNYHSEMNADGYIERFSNRFINYLE